MATKRFELVLRESGQWAIFIRTGAKGSVVDTGHVDRKIAELDLDSWRSSGTLSPTGQGWIRVADRLTANVKSSRSRRRDTRHILNRIDVLTLLKVQGYTCPISGSYFTHDAFDGAARDPFQPSIDRIDASRGYEPDNIRIVCLLVNLAMAEWGEEPLKMISERISARSEMPGLRPASPCRPEIYTPKLRLIPCDS